MSTIQSDFVPKRRLISDVTNAFNALVTTDEDHEYDSDFTVTLFVPKAYGMDLDFVTTKITVTATDQFLTEVNTLPQLDFIEPTFPPGFTNAQSIPQTGETDNAAG